MQTITDLNSLEISKSKGALFILFGGEHCNVCRTLRPQLSSLLEQHFPQMRCVYIDCELSPQICAQYGVFSLPAVKVYIEGMLVIEDARVFSLTSLRQRMVRPYSMWLESNNE